MIVADEAEKLKRPARVRADAVKYVRCKNLIAVLEEPFDLVNIGTVIRNVDALGVSSTYIVDPKKTLPDDWFEMREKRELSKMSVGAVKWSFVKRFDSTSQCLEHLESNHFTSVVTSPHVKGKANHVLHKADYTAPKKLAIWFGNESRGISDLAVERSHFCVAIPMAGMVESLNLAVSTGIVLYEVTKQRREYQVAHWQDLRQKRLNRIEALPTSLKGSLF